MAEIEIEACRLLSESDIQTCHECIHVESGAGNGIRRPAMEIECFRRIPYFSEIKSRDSAEPPNDWKAELGTNDRRCFIQEMVLR